MERAYLHDTWARMLQCPDEVQGGADLAATVAELQERHPESAAHLAPLADLARQLGPGELQERHSRTFDGTASRALELGWHLFGESYSRGAFLVRMRELLREGGVEESGELPDHLGCVLAVLGRADQAVAGALVRGSVLPALDKIAAGFEDPEDAYGQALRGLRTFLDTFHPAPVTAATGARES